MPNTWTHIFEIHVVTPKKSNNVCPLTTEADICTTETQELVQTGNLVLPGKFLKTWMAYYVNKLNYVLLKVAYIFSEIYFPHDYVGVEIKYSSLRY